VREGISPFAGAMSPEKGGNPPGPLQVTSVGAHNPEKSGFRVIGGRGLEGEGKVWS